MNTTAPIDRATGALWQVCRGEALTLPAARGARWLRLREGRLWVTAHGRPDAPPPEDVWLAVGDSLRVAPGTRVLAEGWPAASFEVLEEPQT